MKFRCEVKDDIKLPPTYTLAQAFNYFNPKSNSFYILENGEDFIQCIGSKSRCSIELKRKGEHYVFYSPDGGEEDILIECSIGPIKRNRKHCFHFSKAIELFKYFLEGADFPNDVKLELIK